MISSSRRIIWKDALQDGWASENTCRVATSAKRPLVSAPSYRSAPQQMTSSLSASTSKQVLNLFPPERFSSGDLSTAPAPGKKNRLMQQVSTAQHLLLLKISFPCQ
jgi:hypothetical protein